MISIDHLRLSRVRDARDVIEGRRADPYNAERVPGGGHRGV